MRKGEPNWTMHAWIDARQRDRPSHTEVQAVREVGLIQSRERSALARRRRSGLGGSPGQSGMGAWLISSPRSLGAGMLALRWLVQGYGYEITGADVWTAYSSMMKAAEKNENVAEIRERVKGLVASEAPGGFVTRILGRELGE